MSPHIDAATPHPFLGGTPKRLLIGGQWRPAASGRTFDTHNPASGARLAAVAEGDAADVDAAVQAARAAFEGPWSRFKPDERQALLLRLADVVEAHHDELAWLDTLDMGAPLRHTRGSRRHLVGLLRWFAGQATALYGQTAQTSLNGDMFAATLKEPVGVVGSIIPWNGPLWATVFKVAPVLATGCTLVLKPSEEAPLAPLRFAELALQAGVPEGVINVVTGFGRGAGAALAAHAGVDKVSFTGSVATGQAIVRASAGNLKRLSLELGGKSPHILFDDADIAAAARAAAMGVFANAGQICSAGTRVYVQRRIHDAVVDAMAEVARSLHVGDGLDPVTDIGPLVSGPQMQKVLDYMAGARDERARLVAGGERLTGPAHRHGHFVAPTVFADVHDPMRIAREEIFGPVAAVMPFDDLDEVVRRANASPYGLGAGVWTRDVGRAHAIARRLQAGSVWVNCYNQMDPSMPFGGVKLSGYGRESGLQHLDEYLHVKGLWIQAT
ncbi:aldehyde dehydrogenase [Aquabacterium sp. J223]|uniref:aldehyde dehydrogenase family protein n=1 Tax=Aquabacterium sp. J223 TaxID=2898431 RepID=UPI0021ADA2CF|nr:aldehyde dehydrogenase family protein [Aquabacterium sp. J223]UUX96149.1 aldehyde dehydrogenase family protein [Aquabacterium sp. J223]